MDTLVNNSRGQFGVLDAGIDANQYEDLKSILQDRVSDPAILQEYIAACVMIARNLNITVEQFADILRAQGSAYNQDIFLAGYLNQNRVANARIGIMLNLNTPVNIAREIQV